MTQEAKLKSERCLKIMASQGRMEGRSWVRVKSFHLQSLHPWRYVVLCLSLLGFKWKCEGHVILCFFFFFFKGMQFNPGFSTIPPSPTLEFHGRHRDKGVRMPEKEFLPLRMAYFKRLLWSSKILYIHNILQNLNHQTNERRVMSSGYSWQKIKEQEISKMLLGSQNAFWLNRVVKG